MDTDIRSHKLGATLPVSVRPGAGRTCLLGEHGPALRLAVAAPPEKGRANKELLRWLSKTLKFPKGNLKLLSGDSSRNKVVLFQKVTPEQLREAVLKILNSKGDLK